MRLEASGTSSGPTRVACAQRHLRVHRSRRQSAARDDASFRARRLNRCYFARRSENVSVRECRRRGRRCRQWRATFEISSELDDGSSSEGILRGGRIRATRSSSAARAVLGDPWPASRRSRLAPGDSTAWWRSEEYSGWLVRRRSRRGAGSPAASRSTASRGADEMLYLDGESRFVAIVTQRQPVAARRHPRRNLAVAHARPPRGLRFSCRRDACRVGGGRADERVRSRRCDTERSRSLVRGSSNGTARHRSKMACVRRSRWPNRGGWSESTQLSNPNGVYEAIDARRKDDHSRSLGHARARRALPEYGA